MRERLLQVSPRFKAEFLNTMKLDGKTNGSTLSYTHSFLAASAQTLVAMRAGDLQLVSIIDKPRGALRRQNTYLHLLL